MPKEKFYIIVLHCIGWLLFFSLPVIFIFSQSLENNGHSFSVNPFTLLPLVIYIIIFYLHTYILFPKLYFAKKKFLYFLSILLLLGAVLFLRPYDTMTMGNQSPGNEMTERRNPPSQNNMDRTGPPHFAPPPGNRRISQHIDIISIVLFILVIALSISLILEKRWRIAVQQAATAEADKANAELSFLKAQVNPHFLFNTLNNIYSLAITKNENVADAIMKLSNIMRYVTDDANEDVVSLEKELDSISNYISLQRLRLGNKVGIDYITEGDVSGKIIAPLILMPFVENAFKHGISYTSPATIVIKITVAENHITFFTENKVFTTPHNLERTGIGNTNTKKRLAQIYPGKHTLDISSKNDLYTVNLVIYF